MICIEPDTEHRDVTFFRLARTLAGRPLYWAGAYLVGGALVDGGPPRRRRSCCSRRACPNAR